MPVVGAAWTGDWSYYDFQVLGRPPLCLMLAPPYMEDRMTMRRSRKKRRRRAEGQKKK